MGKETSCVQCKVREEKERERRSQKEKRLR